MDLRTSDNGAPCRQNSGTDWKLAVGTVSHLACLQAFCHQFCNLTSAFMPNVKEQTGTTSKHREAMIVIVYCISLKCTLLHIV